MIKTCHLRNAKTTIFMLLRSIAKKRATAISMLLRSIAKKATAIAMLLRRRDYKGNQLINHHFHVYIDNRIHLENILR